MKKEFTKCQNCKEKYKKDEAKFYKMKTRKGKQLWCDACVQGLLIEHPEIYVKK